MIPRLLENKLVERLTEPKHKVVVLYGARQVGKTTLVLKALKQVDGKILQINADSQAYTEVLSSTDLNKLKGLVAGYDVLFIDEAQRIPDIGINLKILHDNIPSLKIIVTGSSSLDLANRIKEPLTGRTWTYRLYPISLAEWKGSKDVNDFGVGMNLDEFIRFGLYPEVLSLENHADKQQYLREISDSYLYKDVLALANIRYPEKLRQLLKLLAFQIGNLVSIHELANALQISRDTVTNYIDLLEKSFVIFRLGGFSRNLRKEVVSMDKIYFHDVGIRNTLIENFNPLEFRQDIGPLWENFLLSERRKKMEYERLFGNTYFWRTHTGAELDYVEERNGLLLGFEFKWKSGKAKVPATWLENYENASFEVVNKDNFASFAI